MTQIQSKPSYFIVFVLSKVFSTVIINDAIPHFWIHNSEIFDPRRNIFIIDCSNVDDFHFFLTAEFQHISNILSLVFEFQPGISRAIIMDSKTAQGRARTATSVQGRSSG